MDGCKSRAGECVSYLGIEQDVLRLEISGEGKTRKHKLIRTTKSKTETKCAVNFRTTQQRETRHGQIYVLLRASEPQKRRIQHKTFGGEGARKRGGGAQCKCITFTCVEATRPTNAEVRAGSRIRFRETRPRGGGAILQFKGVKDRGQNNVQVTR